MLSTDCLFEQLSHHTWHSKLCEDSPNDFLHINVTH
jgi:hypothetical protein